jgi:hypothetical protein
MVPFRSATGQWKTELQQQLQHACWCHQTLWRTKIEIERKFSMADIISSEPFFPKISLQLLKKC